MIRPGNAASLRNRGPSPDAFFAIPSGGSRGGVAQTGLRNFEKQGLTSYLRRGPGAASAHFTTWFANCRLQKLWTQTKDGFAFLLPADPNYYREFGGDTKKEHLGGYQKFHCLLRSEVQVKFKFCFFHVGNYFILVSRLLDMADSFYAWCLCHKSIISWLMMF